MRACRVSTSTASQQGHLSATYSLIPVKHLPIPTNYDAGMTRSESVGRARRHAVAAAPCRLLYRALAEALISLPLRGSSGPGGRAVSGSWSNDALFAACRPWLISLPNFCWAFLELVVAASCAASMSVSGGLQAWSPSMPRPHSNQDSETMPVIASFVTSYVFRISHKLPPSGVIMLDSGKLPPSGVITLDSGKLLLTRSLKGPVRS